MTINRRLVISIFLVGSYIMPFNTCLGSCFDVLMSRLTGRLTKQEKEIESRFNGLKQEFLITELFENLYLEKIFDLAKRAANQRGSQARKTLIKLIDAVDMTLENTGCVLHTEYYRLMFERNSLVVTVVPPKFDNGQFSPEMIAKKILQGFLNEVQTFKDKGFYVAVNGAGIHATRP